VYKIKVRPEDFVVRELVSIPLAKSGNYTILKLEKQLWNTLDVIDFVARKMRLPKRFFSRAGLKDRYSLSTQYLSFKGGFKRTLKEKNFTLKPVGRSNFPVTARMLCGNAFSITLRNLTEKEIKKSNRNATEVTGHGFPNYFDEQRFGSARHGQGFIAKKMIQKHYQGALKILLCYPYKEDSAREKRFKKYCMNHWLDWQGCLEISPPMYRPILKYLCEHPKNFKNAIKKIDQEFLNLYLLAYQSFLFNETLSNVIKQAGEKFASLKYSHGEFVFYRQLSASSTLRTLRLPMLNEKTTLTGFAGGITENVLKKEGITLKAMGLQKMRLRGVRFKAFERNAIIVPADFVATEPMPDDICKNRLKRTIECTLPPGTYATILVKRLFL
jgi:tRNA pseudouridine13 synthase